MKVRELKAMLATVDDDMDVLIPTSSEFDGVFTTPCPVDSGVSQMGIADKIEDLDEPFDEALTPLLIEHKDEFVLVPCGFYEPKDHSHELN